MKDVVFEKSHSIQLFGKVKVRVVLLGCNCLASFQCYCYTSFDCVHVLCSSSRNHKYFSQSTKVKCVPL